VIGSVSALVVDPLSSSRIATGTALVAAGFHVTVADSFAAAKERMAARPPAVLIADICLAEYNGLHLVIRGMANDPKLTAVVICDRDDPVLRESAEKLGATYVVKPQTSDELIAAVMRTLFRQQNDPPLRSPFERRHAERRAAIEVSTLPVDRRLQDRRQGLTAFRVGAVN